MKTVWICGSAYLTSNQFFLVDDSTQNKVGATFDIVCGKIPMGTASMESKICPLAARPSSGWHEETNITNFET
jgi:hypothetical protein